VQKLKSSRKSLIILIVLVCVSAYSTVYTACAHRVASHVTESPPDLHWSSAPAGSFFPWPREPGMLEMLSEMSEVDSFIYVYLIRSWVLVVVTFMLWIGVFLQIWRIARNELIRKESALKEP
jgi:hypothetical protein